MIEYYYRPVGNNGFLNRCQDAALLYGRKLKYKISGQLGDINVKEESIITIFISRKLFL